jgi:RNA-directed DNA polymerase
MPHAPFSLRFHVKSDRLLERLASLRLTVHENAQVAPVASGIPWLGFIVYPTHRRLKARNVHHFNRRLRNRWQSFCANEIRFAEFSDRNQRTTVVTL